MGRYNPPGSPQQRKENMLKNAHSLVMLLMASVSLSSAKAMGAQPAVVLSEFIFESAPFPSCHASTIAQAKEGLVAAWFGGTREGDSTVGIWFSSKDSHGWSAPREAANGVQPDGARL